MTPPFMEGGIDWKWEDVEISGSSGVYPREEGESVSFFQRSFIDDAMDEAMKKTHSR